MPSKRPPRNPVISLQDHTGVNDYVDMISKENAGVIKAFHTAPPAPLHPPSHPFFGAACYFGFGYGCGALAGGFISHSYGFPIMFAVSATIGCQGHKQEAQGHMQIAQCTMTQAEGSGCTRTQAGGSDCTRHQRWATPPKQTPLSLAVPEMEHPAKLAASYLLTIESPYPVTHCTKLAVY
eukprot:1142506-Pelagomonas_calceolata.AAC.2